MLQQTQVERVIPFYKAFLAKFPTAKSLAAAPLPAVLASWQGLGYNRRAKMLRATAAKMKKNMTVEELEALPGVGPYTARAVAAFAYNEDVIFIETNIRTAIIHHFFTKAADRKSRNDTIYDIVSDSQIKEILVRALPKGKSREWYSALMDYGAFLKRSGISYNARSASYAKQSKFAGSLREARGAVLRELVKGRASSSRLALLLGAVRKEQMKSALTALAEEGLIVRKKGFFSLKD
jgi:A/G-specific adenine glycosylase